MLVLPQDHNRLVTRDCSARFATQPSRNFW